MSSNPFDDADGRFCVLVNDAQQHSLWPSCTEVPAGWRIVFGEERRDRCLAYVQEHRSGLVPQGLRDARDAGPVAADAA
jgi:uncharacterized protein YbdZ (MbtH family)